MVWLYLFHTTQHKHDYLLISHRPPKKNSLSGLNNQLLEVDNCSLDMHGVGRDSLELLGAWCVGCFICASSCCTKMLGRAELCSNEHQVGATTACWASNNTLLRWPPYRLNEQAAYSTSNFGWADHHLLIQAGLALRRAATILPVSCLSAQTSTLPLSMCVLRIKPNLILGV